MPTTVDQCESLLVEQYLTANEVDDEWVLSDMIPCQNKCCEPDLRICVLMTYNIASWGLVNETKVYRAS